MQQCSVAIGLKAVQATMDLECIEDTHALLGSSPGSDGAKRRKQEDPCDVRKLVDNVVERNGAGGDHFAHLKTCKTDGCGQCKWVRLHQRWQLQTPMIQPRWNWLKTSTTLATSSSWLGERFCPDGSWLGAGCIACGIFKEDTTGEKKSTSTVAVRGFGDFTVNTGAGLQMSNILRHHKLDWHNSAVTKLVRAIGETDLRGAPSPSEFKAVFDAVAKGDAPSSGIAGVGFRKAAQMVYCLAQGMWMEDREFMRHATMSALIRDDCDDRFAMLCRATNKELTVRKFVLSIQVNSPGDARGKTHATEKAWREFSTPGFGARPASRGNQTEVALDGELFDNTKDIHTQLIVDSCAAEILSGRMMEKALT